MQMHGVLQRQMQVRGVHVGRRDAIAAMNKIYDLVIRFVADDGRPMLRLSDAMAARTASAGDVMGGRCSTAKNRRVSLPSVRDDQA